MEERYYNRTEVCEILGITNFTITNWYRWQNTLIKNGEIDKQYLPAPIRQKNVKGQPLFWTDEMVDELKKYKDSIIHGRNGVYGKFTNKKRQ